MQGIYNCIPETNHISRVCSVAAVLYLQFVLHVMLFHVLNMFHTFTLALPEVCVQRPLWQFFCGFLIRAFSVCCWGIVWMILRWLQLTLLLLVSLVLSYSTCAEFVIIIIKWRVIWGLAVIIIHVTVSFFKFHAVKCFVLSLYCGCRIVGVYLRALSGYPLFFLSPLLVRPSAHVKWVRVLQ